MFYLFEIASECKSIQTNGASIIVHFSDVFHISSFDGKLARKFWSLATKFVPVRIRSLHCLHSNFVLKTVLPLLRAAFGKDLRHRFIIHCGTREETIKSLREYGILRNSIPMSCGGDLRATGKIWLHERRTVERIRDLRL